MILTSTKDAVTTLTLCRPPVNAIGEEWVRGFEAKLDDLANGPPCTVLHIRSDQKVFCAGADLKEVRGRMETPGGADQMYAFVAGIQRLFARLEQLPQVVLAEIGGAALGGGLELALACDLRIAANEAKLGLPEVRLGLVPGAGGTQRLTRLAGCATALRTAESPGEALAACKSCIAAARDPARDGYAEELAQSRRLYANEASRAL